MSFWPVSWYHVWKTAFSQREERKKGTTEGSIYQQSSWKPALRDQPGTCHFLFRVLYFLLTLSPLFQRWQRLWRAKGAVLSKPPEWLLISNSPEVSSCHSVYDKLPGLCIKTPDFSLCQPMGKTYFWSCAAVKIRHIYNFYKWVYFNKNKLLCKHGL